MEKNIEYNKPGIFVIFYYFAPVKTPGTMRLKEVADVFLEDYDVSVLASSNRKFLVLDSTLAVDPRIVLQVVKTLDINNVKSIVARKKINLVLKGIYYFFVKIHVLCLIVLKRK